MCGKQQLRGLTQKEVEQSRQLHGENVLTPPAKASLWSQFLEKFEDPIIRILLVAWLLSMIIAGVHCWGPDAKGFTAFLEPVGIFFAILFIIEAYIYAYWNVEIGRNILKRLKAGMREN